MINQKPKYKALKPAKALIGYVYFTTHRATSTLFLQIGGKTLILITICVNNVFSTKTFVCLIVC